MTGEISLMVVAGFLTALGVSFQTAHIDEQMPLDRLVSALLLGIAVSSFGLALLKAIGEVH